MNDSKHFEMAYADDPEGFFKAAQLALIVSMKKFLEGAKSDIKQPGLTWEQIDFMLDEFAKKKPTVFYQEEEM